MISQQITKKHCPHFQKLKISEGSPHIHAPFIKPVSTGGWICLYDGCVKKIMQHQQLVMESYKLEDSHKVFMQMDTLEIYCTKCQKQITDDQYPLARKIRQAAFQVNPEQQKILFAGHTEYPPAFQKEKAGVCGTIGNQLNSYVGAILQLLAHTPAFYQIAEQCLIFNKDFSKNTQTNIKSQMLLNLFEKIAQLRSGKFRIIKIEDLENIILKNNHNFFNYSMKNPASLQYEILRAFSDQFIYDGPECDPKQAIPPFPLDKINPSKKNYRAYSPMKQLFSGSFKWTVQCPQCKHQKAIFSQFQCIRLQCDQHNRQVKHNAQLFQLISSTFDLFSPHNNPLQQSRSDKFCEKCLESSQYNEDNLHKCPTNEIIKDKCGIKMPNMLLLEFGNTSQGLKTNLPDQLDLSSLKILPSYDKNNSKNNTKQEYIFEYVGCIGKIKKKYVCHIRQEKQKENGNILIKNYLFDDVIIKQDTAIEKPQYVKSAIYKLKPLLRNKNIARNIQSSVEVDVKCFVPLPDFWYHYLTNLRFIQPLVSPFLCPHGYLRPNVQSKSQVSRKIPPQIYQYLIEQFGGICSLVTTQQSYCQACAERLNLLNQIKVAEKQIARFADRLSNKKARVCIDIEWLDRWKKYLYEQCRNTYAMEGYRRPGPINNRKGVKQQENDIDDSKYKKISPEVWYYFKKFYGGGPLITKQKTQPSLALVQAVNLKFEAIKDSLQKYLNKD